MYIPLFTKSFYSLLSSLLTIDDIIEYAERTNINAIALADNNMYGTMEFYKKCEKSNIKPIIGLDIQLENTRVVLYAKNYDGYKSLIKLESLKNHKELTYEHLSKYNNELICIVPFEYMNDFSKLKVIYPDIYLGYKNKSEELEALLITKNVIFFRENLYLSKEDSDTLTYLYRIRDGKTISDEIDYDIDNHEMIIKNILDLTDNKGLVNIIKVVDNCNLKFPEGKSLLPIYECDDPKQYLFDLCRAGISKRLNHNVPLKYQERLIYELNVINEMGFANYFLVVYDFIKFAKKHDILVGPGRGSAAGSLVAYSLGITEIDPLKYDLLFERFLNPDRKTMPDIDTDFPDNKRGEVIKYVVEKYGSKRVCGIVTFGTLGVKQVIRDVSRVLNIPIYKVDGLCKLIPKDNKGTLQDIYQKSKLFRARVDSDNSLKNMYEIAVKLEGYPRHTSSHAAGIVMSEVDLDEVIPLTTGDGMYLSEYNMDYLEDMGLLKMDFLGLKNLSIIDNILTDIYKETGNKIEFSKIPLDDSKALSLFATGNTTGIFQFESDGMRNFLKRLKPNSFDDICAAIALFRPGPAINIDTYIRRKHNEEKTTYIDDSLKPILKSTYGILIYQEQIMQVASVYAGYSLKEADILRRAMSKKKADLLKAEEDKFIEKSMKLQHPYEEAKKLFDLILNFAGYGFNKSHSVAYSMIAYKMAYLKTYYPKIFFANLLTSVIGSETKTKEYIMDMRSNKIDIVKPTINESTNKYKVKDNSIIYPLSNIKSIGTVIYDSINKAKKDTPFTDIYDALSKLCVAGVGKKAIEVLIYANVFRDFNYNRKTLIENLDSLYNYAELTKDIDPSLVFKPDINEKEEYKDAFLLEKEKELFGFYLSSYPTTIYKKDNPYCILLKDITKYFNKTIDSLVLIDNIKLTTTKKGDKMAFVTGSDETATQTFVFFPTAYSKFQPLERGRVIKVRGKVERRFDEYQIVVDRIKYLDGEDNDKKE